MRHDLRAEAQDTAYGAALVADEIALAVGPDRQPVELAPAAVARPLRRLRRAAAIRIVAQAAVKTVGCLVAKPLQEIRAEIEHLIARRNLGIDDGRHRCRCWCRRR